MPYNRSQEGCSSFLRTYAKQNLTIHVHKCKTIPNVSQAVELECPYLQFFHPQTRNKMAGQCPDYGKHKSCTWFATLLHGKGANALGIL
eukprot:scaffold110_cov315-Pavlova_lutheri.AAC.59